MKTVKINYPVALLLIVAILAPITAIGGNRDAASAGPIDDQPWGGEVNNSDFMTGSINSIGNDPYPGQIGFIPIMNFGTPMVLIDYLRFFIFDYTLNTRNSYSTRQINLSTAPESRNFAPMSTRTRRSSIRKGR